MPAIDLSTLLDARLDNSSSDNSSFAPSLNSTVLQVICAWPVSGQYGPGTRILYYVLVAACVVARKVEWLRNACLAAALLFPVTAGVHGIVLAAVNTTGAVDMDIYGAFQLLAVGVLVAPVSVRLSSTYSNDQGRNVIFVWSAITFAGLLSLVVQFYRTQTQPCNAQYNGSYINTTAQFPFNETTFTCGITCDVQNGPFSPIRLGSANNIYVIPAPTVLNFRAATLLAAACCIPTVLLPASMWIRILRQNHKIREERRIAQERQQERGEDAAVAEEALYMADTSSERESVEGLESPEHRKLRKRIQKYPAIAIFGCCVLAVIVVGEMNFFSIQVSFQTDYMANVGQWAALVGTGFAVMGSVYVMVANEMDNERKRMEAESEDQEGEPQSATEKPMPTVQPAEPAEPDSESSDILRRIARVLVRFSNYISNPSDTTFEDIRDNKMARNRWPEYPGEFLANPKLPDIIRTYTRRNSNESSNSRASTNRRRSDTRNSSITRTETLHSTSQAPTRARGRRATLDVPHRRSTNSTLPVSPPIDADDITPASPTAPAIVISDGPS